MIFTQSTHIWIINTADHRFRSIKDEDGGQVSSIAGNDWGERGKMEAKKGES